MATDTKISFFNGDSSKIAAQISAGVITPCDFVVGTNDDTFHYIDSNKTDHQLGVSASQLATAKADTAIYNNGKYAGQNLATVLASEIGTGTVYSALQSRAKNNNFKDIRVGDYIDVPLTNASAITSATSVRFLVAHIDPYYQCGDSAKGHHIAFVSSAPIAVSTSYSGATSSGYLSWNASSTNQGTADEKHPYLCSQLKGWETAFEGTLPAELTNVMLTQRVRLEERYSASGALTDSNSWSWANIGKIWSLSETEVYGQCVWGTPGYSVGFDCQFDLFHDTAHRLNGVRDGWWLRSVHSGSSSDVCYVHSDGHAGNYGATGTWGRPRVGFLLG